MKTKKLDHLAKIYNEYDAFIIDLWGVMHNGIKLNSSAINAVKELDEKGKKIVFLSNAPRPTKQVVEFLKKMKMDNKFLKNVLTSGEAALNSLKKNKFGKKFYHLGPVRDDSLFFDIKENKTTIDKCDFILCTGLFDEEENLNYYENLLKNFTNKKLICTNPDLTVHRGDISEFCAGTIASIFKNIGGDVIYFGKPYTEIYKMFLKDNERAIAIGDNLNTDILGANRLKIDSVFIYEGIHKNEIKNEKDIVKLLQNYDVIGKFYQSKLKW